MNRNVESHFAELPHTEVQRSIFDRSFSHKSTGNVGDLIPFMSSEILPGDSVKISTSKIIRLQTLLTPIMDNIVADFFYFFVPLRLIWSHTKEFFGENTQSAWLPSTEYFMPQFVTANADTDGVKSCTLADYFGLPLGLKHPASDITKGSYLDCMRFRAYSLIWNEFFRDENLQDPLPLDVSDSNLVYDATKSDKGGIPAKVAKFHDYFTSALPAPQKGPAVTLPIGGDMSISGNGSLVDQRVIPIASLSYPSASGLAATFKVAGDGESASYYLNNSPLVLSENRAGLSTDSTYQGNLFPSNLGVVSRSVSLQGATVNLSDATMASVNDIRLAFQLQKFYEVNARSGSRYIEVIKAHFNVSSPDARLQRPEYLGGNRVPITIHQITNNAESSGAYLGNVGAMSVTSDVSEDVEKSFTEHGLLLGLMCLRSQRSYQNGVDRSWMRRNSTDFYWPVFAHLGEQPIKNGEIFWSNDYSVDTAAFGYQEAWAEYRYAQNLVSGEFRSGIANTLDSWHLADDYTTLPTLSDGWIQEDKSNVDRVLAVTSSVANQFFFDIYVKNIMTRPMPMYSVPGLIDHM